MVIYKYINIYYIHFYNYSYLVKDYIPLNWDPNPTVYAPIPLIQIQSFSYKLVGIFIFLAKISFESQVIPNKVQLSLYSYIFPNTEYI